MAHMAKASVQPLAIVGARDITPRGSHLHRFGRVYLRAGDPIEFFDLDAKGKKAQVAAMESVAMGRVYELRDGLRGGAHGLVRLPRRSQRVGHLPARWCMKAPRYQFAPGTLQQMPTRTQRLRVTLGVALWFCAIAIGVVVSIMWRGAL